MSKVEAIGISSCGAPARRNLTAARIECDAGMPTRILSEAELRRVVGVDAEALRAVEDAFGALQRGRVAMPPILHLPVRDRDGDIDVKGAYVRGLPLVAIKIAAGFRDNPAQGLPAGSALMVVLDARTGRCEAILLDESYLTDLRTGLAGAVAAKYLAPEAVETVGVLGTGVQARYQVECLGLVRKFRRILVWGRSREKAERYAAEMGERLGTQVLVASAPGEAARASQVLLTATASEGALVGAGDLHPGLHITAVGSDLPGKQELAPEVLLRADRLVCDRLAQCRENGEIQHLLRDGELPAGREIVELGALVCGDAPGRRREDEITVCDLTGTGVQDTAIANLAHAAALAQGLGTLV
jgi:ornithine cyclodeaminase